MKDYQTVDGEFQIKYEILRSVFICTIKGIESFEQGIGFCRKVSKKYSDATHNCYAVITSDSQKCSDDGEPQGTAGQPILQVIKNNRLINVSCVVTRYFGGIKLGAGGLVQAYTKSVADCIKECKIVTKTLSITGKLSLDYNEYALLSSFIKSNNFLITNTEFGDLVDVSVAIPVDKKQFLDDTIAKLTSGKKQIEYIAEDYFIFP